MQKNKDFIISVIKASCLTLICGLCLVLLFSVVVKFTALSDTAIKTVNQFIKVIAVFIGCFFSVKGKMGAIKGGIAGVLGVFLIYLIFSLMSGAKIFTVQTLADFGLSLVVGAISGIISVNTRGKEEQ